MSLWASDSLAPDPVAMSIDDMGRVYLTRTNRMKNSEFDIRGYRHWMTESIGFQTVEDRRMFLRKTFAPEKSGENEWLKDLNEDGIHDWKDLTVEKDEIWRLEDTSASGFADVATRIFTDFNEEITDVAGGLLVHGKEIFYAIAPDLWKLTDTNNDGFPDKNTSISHGYGVHIGFSGHNMSGVVEGPDGRIYWNMGDIGGNVTALNGEKFPNPNSGFIARSNPDGSDFEIFATGLRNTHEFVFDEYGNIISNDNDGDYPGESERLVHVVQGSDAGWRSNWQYGKYTDPKNNRYNVWIDEKMFKPRWEGQAAYIIPPIQNFHNGPTGMVYNPGTALGSAWKNGRIHLPLLVDYNGQFFGKANAKEMHFHFGQLIAHAAKTRDLAAGTLIGSGTVSNEDMSQGSSCLVEKRTLEQIHQNEIKTPYMSDGDTIEIKMLSTAGENIFGTIFQKVQKI